MLSELTDEFAGKQLFHFHMQLVIHDSEPTATQIVSADIVELCFKNRLLSHNFSAGFFQGTTERMFLEDPFTLVMVYTASLIIAL